MNSLEWLYRTITWLIANALFVIHLDSVAEVFAELAHSGDNADFAPLDPMRGKE